MPSNNLKTLHRRLLATGLALLGAFLAGCGEPPAPEPEPDPDAPEERDVTSGLVRFTGIPEAGLTAREIMVVALIEPETLELLQQQRLLFERQLSGAAEQDLSQSSQSIMAAADRAELNAELEALKAAFPEPLFKDIDLGNNRLRKFRSDAELHEAYRKLFAALEIENLEKGINFINQRIEADAKALNASLADADPDTKTTQITSLEWLGQVAEHLKSYVPLAAKRVDAINAYAAASGSSSPQTWPDFMARHHYPILTSLSRNLRGSTYVDDDGPFVAGGHGQVIARVEYGALSAYFLADDPDESRVEFENLRQTVELLDASSDASGVEGQVHFTGLEGHTISGAEILLVADLEFHITSLLEKQRRYLEDFLQVSAAHPDPGIDLFAADWVRIEQRIEALQPKLPAKMRVQLRDESEEASQMFSSNEALFMDYQASFAEIGVENLEDKITELAANLDSDLKRALEDVYSDNEAEMLKANLDVNWLLQLQEALVDFRALSARKKMAVEDKKNGNPPFDSWEGLINANGPEIETALREAQVSAAPLGEDGSFALRGEGSLVVRVMLDGRRAYFMDDTDDNRVRIESRFRNATAGDE